MTTCAEGSGLKTRDIDIITQETCQSVAKITDIDLLTQSDAVEVEVVEQLISNRRVQFASRSRWCQWLRQTVSLSVVCVQLARWLGSTLCTPRQSAYLSLL